MAVLILAPERDEHAIAVKRHLELLGNEADVLDTSLFPEACRLAQWYRCCNKERRLALDVQGRILQMERYGSVWWRRPQVPRLSDQMLRASHREFAANEVHEALMGLWYSLDARWVNDPVRDQVAQRKAYQLKIAQEVGLRIPTTLMTNDPDEARRFVDARAYRKVVYKSFSSTEQEWRETRILRDDEMLLLDQVSHAPVIFQHYVEAKYDLRISTVGDELFPAAIHSQQTDYTVDCRIDISQAKIAAVEIPDDIEDRLRELKRCLGLVYGAIDMRLTPEGDYVFLEINPGGQFMYIEAATGLPIANAMAAELNRLDCANHATDLPITDGGRRTLRVGSPRSDRGV
jgi:glutathione synthase/RimK-type ligase-like ATP-grasp enzyme